jgi:hypothetical protein
MADSQASIPKKSGSAKKSPDVVPNGGRYCSARSGSLVTLPEILLKGVELAADRRKTRYSRLRKAVENGLVDANALKVKRRVSQLTEAVDRCWVMS